MSLATRCTSCGTVFRVVQDQLKISEGWVRCGQCSEVFNAVDTLFDIDGAGAGSSPAPTMPSAAEAALPPPVTVAPANHPSTPISLADDAVAREAAETDAAPAFSDTDVLPSADETREFETFEDADMPAMASAARGETSIAIEESNDAPAVALVAPAAVAPSVAFVTPTAPSTSTPPPVPTSSPRKPESTDVDIDVEVRGPVPTDVPRPSKSFMRKSAASSRRRADFTDARFDSDSAESDIDIDAEVAAALDNDPRRIRKHRPEFLRRAERAARWNSRPAKIGLASLSMVAGVALGAQVTYHFRDDTAVRWPVVKPMLQSWCARAGCNIDAPRVIDDIAVESTTLTQGTTADSFKLAVMLRSRGRYALMTPSVSLTLTDLNGHLVSRKVMSPVDFRVPAVIAPGTEVAMKATLSTPNAHVTGYTVETFYP